MGTFEYADKQAINGKSRGSSVYLNTVLYLDVARDEPRY